MDARIALLGAASFMGGLFVTSRVIAWVTLLVLSFKSPPGASGKPLGVAPLVLHSGPWALAFAIGGVWYAASSSQQAYLRAVGIGLGLAVALMAGVIARAVLRSRSAIEPPPLTAERLLLLRRRFFWRNSLFFAVANPLFLFLFFPDAAAWGLGVILVACGASFLGGWVWSWFMWQWYGESLKVGEKRRRQREQNAV
jgi:hypothetical protein